MRRSLAALFTSLALISLAEGSASCSVEQTGGGFGGAGGSASVTSASAPVSGAGGAAPSPSGSSGGAPGVPVATSDEGPVCPMPGLSCPDPQALMTAQ
jgi:hypothetical protein